MGDDNINNTTNLGSVMPNPAVPSVSDPMSGSAPDTGAAPVATPVATTPVATPVTSMPEPAVLEPAELNISEVVEPDIVSAISPEPDVLVQPAVVTPTVMPAGATTGAAGQQTVGANPSSLEDDMPKATDNTGGSMGGATA